MGVDSGIASAAIEDVFQLAVADIQETFSVVLSSEYAELESQTGQAMIRKYTSATDDLVARVFVSPEKGASTHFWVVDENRGDHVLQTTSSGSSQELPTKSEATEPVGTLTTLSRPTVTPLADDPGAGDGYNCVEYCRLAQNTYAVYEYSQWVELIKYWGPAACAAAGGSYALAGAGLGYVCYVLVEEIWTEKELISTECVDWSIACSDHPNRGPNVPRTQYLPHIYVPGN